MPPPPGEQKIRGVKRKRLDDEELEKNKDTKLHRKLHHALKELRKTVRKARTFEVQKTLKKLREARRHDPESDVVKDLESQVEALKNLDYDQLAQSALMTKLRKDNTLSVDPSIQAIAVKLASNVVPPGAPGTPTAKVQSRILSSKVLASEIVSILQTLRTLLHPFAGLEDIEEVAKGSHRSPIVSKRRTGTSSEKVVLLSKDNVTNTSGGPEVTAEVDDGWESGTVDASSGSDDSMTGSVADRNSNDSGDEADTPSEQPRRKDLEVKGRTEFIPSLSVGFTRGDSGSEFSDSEAKLADGIKKNRRGQRARRAIWEKKFGKNANHIKKRQRPGSVPIDRRSSKGNSLSRPHHTPWSRAPTRGHEHSNRPTLGGPEGIKNSGSTKGQSEGGGHVREKQGERPLHPSWVAKRKQKGVGIVASQGTKIVFT